ncbi:MAG: hypothetical protein CMO98_06640 [Woeseia sp.]|nr:hypothetical protein [Woeseia sp.]
MPDKPDLLMADIKARQEALDITKSFIVQAPAGSGKTELLIQRYLALLSIVEDPEEVLAITFTRKAAFEMQSRVLESLRKAAQGMSADSDHEGQTLRLARNVLEQDKRQGWAITQSPARMRICTVDAFGAGISRSLPMTSGLGGIGSTVTDADAELLYRNAAAATLDHLSVDAKQGKGVEMILRHLDSDTNLYIRYLSQMLKSRDQWLGITGSGISDEGAALEARRELERNIETAINRQLLHVDQLLPDELREKLPGLLNRAGRNLKDAGNDKHPLVDFVGVNGLPKALAVEREAWAGIAKLLVTKAGLWRSKHDKRDGFSPKDRDEKEVLLALIKSNHSNDALREGFLNLRDLPFPKYNDEQWNVLLALLNVLPLAVAELRRLFSEQAVTDHIEVALAAGRALGKIDEPGDIALMLDYKVQHLLVDEMQDTSIGQYDVLRKLTAGWVPSDGRTIFCVGDPMQSIYRFRDAEVGEFLLAQRNGIGNIALKPLTLRRNFRSGGDLVQWFNEVFSLIMPQKEDPNVGAITYSSSIPVESMEGLGECFVQPLFDASHAQEAARTLEVIQKCIKQNDEDNLAVLVRSRTHLVHLMPILRQAGIEYEAVEIDRLTDRPEIIDLIALTRALCHEGDRLAWLALLRGPWCGLRWRDLHALVSGDYEQTVLEICQTPEVFSKLSIEGQELLSSLLVTLKPYIRSKTNLSLRERVEQVWCQLGGPTWIKGESELQNAYLYLEMLDELSFAGTLKDILELEERLESQRVSTTVSAECRVQLMTIHKAKGLQFDHVLLHAVGRRPRGDTREVLTWLNLPDSDVKTNVLISPIGHRGASDVDPLYRFIARTDKEKTKRELGRLLYVACTRAKSSLHIVGSVKVSKDGGLSKPAVNSLLEHLWPAVAGRYEHAFTACQQARGQNDLSGKAPQKADIWRNPVLRRLPKSWRLPSPPEPDFLKNLPGRDITDDTLVDYYWVGAAARNAGTIVHRWLQRLAEKGTDVAQLDYQEIHDISRKWAEAMGVPVDETENVCQRVEDAIRNVTEDPKGRWLLEGDGACELPITGLFNGRVESIVIDRVRIDSDGTHWIVDYKTSSHEGGDLDVFLQQEAERYRGQLQRYSRIYNNLAGVEARTALYFPLLKKFHEVKV